MSLISTPPPPSIFLPKTLLNHRLNHRFPAVLRRNSVNLSLFSLPHHRSSSRSFASLRPSQIDDDEEPEPGPEPVSVRDEWGEKSGSEPQPETRFSAPDPPTREDEDGWGSGSSSGSGSGSVPSPGYVAKPEVEVGEGEKKNWELKRCLVDTVYGSDFGFQASAEDRAEVAELINQLEAGNPVSNPTEAPELLDGNWVLVYTAASELLPLLAVGTTPLLKVERISQNIDTNTSTVENATTLSSPFATFSFSATASFDVRSPSRIQVQFKEATFKPPEVKSHLNLPENLDIFGQKISLSPVQQLLNPVQQAASSISGALYGLPPLKVPIPGERTSSWLIITYLDDDLRISRGDGGLFVLVREGSPLLDQ
ncbi:hypothetical protein RND81_08G145900 [Saponaria officinalis]|uniref:Plastid lipid-associated protein/fibrillin conserved domain-containing protein n=1 Tax=Saponaria officinalis TaxID=3572 RepID=A0AAW1J7I8_SAPOF